jgi:hypothetical protein
MADLSITATSVIPGADAVTVDGTCGETIAAGKWVYKDPTTKQWLLADSNVLAKDDPEGIALSGGAVGQPLEIQTGGTLTIGGTMTAGIPYFLSETPGGMQPLADLAAVEKVTLLGISMSTTVFLIAIARSGVIL